MAKVASDDKVLIESRFETLISKSKDYINNRDVNDLTTLREDIENLQESANRALENMDNGHSANYLTSRKLLLSIIEKFTCSVDLMENMKSKKPLCEQFDTKQMLDILLPNIKYLIEYENWSKNLDTNKFEQDFKYIEELEEQHKRVLLTYLIQDWHNLDEVMNSLKIGEIYKNIAEKLVSLSLISDYWKKQN